MKAVAFTDLHLGVSAFNSRMQNMLSHFLGQLLNEVKPDVVICLGDVFHTKKPAADTVEFATQFFKKIADNVENVMILPGNHDTDAMNNTTATDFLDDITTNIEVLHEPVETMDFLFMPYYRVLTPELRKMIRIHPQVFLHQGYSEAIIYGSTKYGVKPDSVTDSELENKDLAVFGHIHAPSYNPKKNLYVLGSPYQIRYADSLQERGFACWDMENPKSFKIVPYKKNYYLQTINIAVQASQSILEDVIKALPSPARDYYYQINLSIEGKLHPATSEKIRAYLNDAFKGVLDSVSIVSVVPQKDRKFYTGLKLASSMHELKAPSEMLSLYIDQTQETFYKTKPQMKKAIIDEFTDIVTALSEQGQ